MMDHVLYAYLRRKYGDDCVHGAQHDADRSHRCVRTSSTPVPDHRGCRCVPGLHPPPQRGGPGICPGRGRHGCSPQQAHQRSGQDLVSRRLWCCSGCARSQPSLHDRTRLLWFAEPEYVRAEWRHLGGTPPLTPIGQMPRREATHPGLVHAQTKPPRMRRQCAVRSEQLFTRLGDELQLLRLFCRVQLVLQLLQQLFLQQLLLPLPSAWLQQLQLQGHGHR